MTREPVYWQGQQLPDAAPGNVWGAHINTDGTYEVREYPLATMQHVTMDAGVGNLLRGLPADVWLDDLNYTLIVWKNCQEEHA